jgi:hypothetical protein
MHPGVGVMLGYLGGNEETVNAIKTSLNKKIEDVALVGDNLVFLFEDKTKLTIFDDGQSCCESRYMRTDDDLTAFKGAVFTNIELKNAPEVEDDYGSHEVQFLEITTDKGSFVMSNHNEHNGYYGGFWIVAKLKLA